MSISRQQWMRGVLALVGALVLASFGFLFRFNALGGALGGFDNDEFQILTRVDLLLAGEQPLRDFADSDLRGVWPALSYEVPAFVQRVWGRNLLVHAWLTLGALSLCAAVVFLLARMLSRSWVCALLAGALVLVSGVKPYNYTKVLTLTVAAVGVYHWMRAPSRLRLCALAAWTVIAALFRHDYGVYVAIAIVVALVVTEPRPWRVPLRRVSMYAALCLLFALPSIVWVATYSGIPRYLDIALSSIRAEGRRLEQWPVLDLASPFGESSLVAFNYYAFWMLPFAAGATLMWGVWRARSVAADDADRRFRFGVVLVPMALVVNVFFLRANLQARFGDAVVPVALTGAWLAGAAALSASRLSRVLAFAGTLVLLAAMCAAFVGSNSLVHEFETGGLTVSLDATRLRFHEVVRTLRELPSTNASQKEGPMAVSRYLHECTSPDDRVFMGLYADEIPYFARRLVAAGQGYFAHGFLRSDADQRLAVERLSRQSVPVVITAFDYDKEIAGNYPLVARHISSRYREVGTFTVAGHPYIRVFADIMRPSRGTDPVSGFPCFR